MSNGRMLTGKTGTERIAAACRTLIDRMNRVYPGRPKEFRAPDYGDLKEFLRWNVEYEDVVSRLDELDHPPEDRIVRRRQLMIEKARLEIRIEAEARK